MTIEREPYRIGPNEYAERLRIERRHGQAFGVDDPDGQRLTALPVREWGDASQFAYLPSVLRRCRWCDQVFEVGRGAGIFCSLECREARARETVSHNYRKLMGRR